MNDVLDMHTHTIASGHAYNTIQEMAREAAEKGVQLLGITEHAPTMPGTCHLFYFQNLHVVPREMYGVELMLGAEVNIIDYNGNVDLENNLLKKMDIVIASLHTPCIESGNIRQNTSAVIGAMKNPYISIIGHPDDSRFPLDYDEVVKAAKDNGILLEINNSSISPGTFRQNARENIMEMLKLCKYYEVPVIMSSDAHCDLAIGFHQYVRELTELSGFPEELIKNDSPEWIKKFISERRAKKFY